ncbi:MAG: hypothetical protein NTV34_02500 [Proteobacteria bacterium]|nr:hypothetical protein [Pseudomonadota bacterium]
MNANSKRNNRFLVVASCLGLVGCNVRKSDGALRSKVSENTTNDANDIRPGSDLDDGIFVRGFVRADQKFDRTNGQWVVDNKVFSGDCRVDEPISVKRGEQYEITGISGRSTAFRITISDVRYPLTCFDENLASINVYKRKEQVNYITAAFVGTMMPYSDSFFSPGKCINIQPLTQLRQEIFLRRQDGSFIGGSSYFRMQCQTLFHSAMGFVDNLQPVVKAEFKYQSNGAAEFKFEAAADVALAKILTDFGTIDGSSSFSIPSGFDWSKTSLPKAVTDNLKTPGRLTISGIFLPAGTVFYTNASQESASDLIGNHP